VDGNVYRDTSSGFTKVTVIRCNYYERRNNLKIHERLELAKYSHGLHKLGTTMFKLLWRHPAVSECLLQVTALTH